jgi:hypothetical protein
MLGTIQQTAKERSQAESVTFSPPFALFNGRPCKRNEPPAQLPRAMLRPGALSGNPAEPVRSARLSMYLAARK